jgi:hypothetical protein
MSVPTIKPIYINEELSRTKSQDVIDLEKIIEELNSNVKLALTHRRDKLDFQFKTYNEKDIDTIISLYKKQEGVKVDILNKNEIKTVVKTLYIVDIKVSW